MEPGIIARYLSHIAVRIIISLRCRNTNGPSFSFRSSLILHTRICIYLHVSAICHGILCIARPRVFDRHKEHRQILEFGYYQCFIASRGPPSLRVNSDHARELPSGELENRSADSRGLMRDLPTDHAESQIMVNIPELNFDDKEMLM